MVESIFIVFVFYIAFTKKHTRTDTHTTKPRKLSMYYSSVIQRSIAQQNSIYTICLFIYLLYYTAGSQYYQCDVMEINLSNVLNYVLHIS